MTNKTTMSSIFSKCKNVNKVDPSKRTFEFIESRLNDSSLVPTNDVTAISNWFKVKYEEVYNRPMIGYNFYNCRITIQNLAKNLECTNWEVCCNINKWFKTFHSLGYDKVASDNTLTLSILKTSWVVEGLKNNRGPNSNSRNASYKQHGQGRRQISPNKTRQSTKSF